MSDLFPGITTHRVASSRYAANVLERPGEGEVVVFIHGNVSSAAFYQPTMLALPREYRALAIDLRGFGASETLPVDATRGLRDFSDDVISVLDALDVERAHVVGWSMGGGVAMQLLLDAPDRVSSLSLEAPVSPYGFGGTHGADGLRNDDDGAGTGGGGANPDFVARLRAGDLTADAPTSPRSVLRSAYVAHPDAQAEHEDVWVRSMLTTSTGEGNYPGDSVPSSNWPGFAAGNRGVLNTMAPQHFDVSGIADAPHRPPILWVHGAGDVIVSDTSLFDLNHLGALGVIPGWPGAEVAPAQPMKQQTRAMLARYAAAGGVVREVEITGAGHAPHLDDAPRFDAELAAHLAAVDVA
ncbi:alpha/beta fold hydrolase [Microbacterium sp. ZW T5_56]|uniref:alpha/beta fold hydrolase n=1 Tax=Microbacterium sp. ZW T5_56 TaxID=3378081 RepID=UPI003852A5FB